MKYIEVKELDQEPDNWTLEWDGVYKIKTTNNALKVKYSSSKGVEIWTVMFKDGLLKDTLDSDKAFDEPIKTTTQKPEIHSSLTEVISLTKSFEKLIQIYGVEDVMNYFKSHANKS